MNRSRLVGIVAGCAIVILLVSASARSQAPQPPRSEVGTFQLFKITKNGEDELYRINTKTGQVWLHSEYVVPSSDMISTKGPEKDGLDKLIAEAGRQGKHVYTRPYWDLTAEKRPDGCTIR